MIQQLEIHGVTERRQAMSCLDNSGSKVGVNCQQMGGVEKGGVASGSVRSQSLGPGARRRDAEIARKEGSIGEKVKKVWRSCY